MSHVNKRCTIRQSYFEETAISDQIISRQNTYMLYHEFRTPGGIPGPDEALRVRGIAR
jgi:hypothetical protein